MRIFQKDSYIALDYLQKSSEIYQLVESGTETEMVLGEIGVGDRKKKIIYRQPEIHEVNGLKMELEAFIRTIRGESPKAVTGEEGREALALALEIIRCMEG